MGIALLVRRHHHYDDVIMSEIASQITSLTIVYSTVLSGADQSKHQSSASLAFVWEIHRWPVNFPHKWPVTRKIFPFDDVIMIILRRPQRPLESLLVEDKNSSRSHINSLWPSDAIWRHRSKSTLAHDMDCCLMAPSLYLYQCWLLIKGD